MSKNVQISEELFVMICKYHLFGQTSLSGKIEALLNDKLDAIQRRHLYTTYKTALTDAEREDARLKYLDSVGMFDEWRH